MQRIEAWGNASYIDMLDADPKLPLSSEIEIPLLAPSSSPSTYARGLDSVSEDQSECSRTRLKLPVQVLVDSAVPDSQVAAFPHLFVVGLLTSGQ
jgi:hypothetical protein